MSKIALKNLDNRPYQFTEYHAVVCAARGTCSCEVQHKVGPGGKLVAQHYPRSFRLPIGETVEADAEVLRLRPLSALVKAGKVQKTNPEPTKE